LLAILYVIFQVFRLLALDVCIVNCFAFSDDFITVLNISFYFLGDVYHSFITNNKF